MKLFKNKFFYCLLVAGLGISISACSTDNPSGVPGSNESTSSVPTSSENHSSSEDSSSAGSTTSSNTDGDGSSSGGSQGDGSADVVERIKSMDYANLVDPADDILGGSSAQSKSALRKMAIDEKDEKDKKDKEDPYTPPAPVGNGAIVNPQYQDLETYWVDRLGGTCTEESDYYSWRNLAPLQGQICESVVKKCETFGTDMLSEMQQVIQYMPDDITFNKKAIHVERGEMAPGVFIDLPMNFYLKGNPDDYTIYFGYELDYGPTYINISNGFRMKKDTDGEYIYEFFSSSIGRGRYDYMPLRLHGQPGGQELLKYDTTNQRYNLHNKSYNSFEIQNTATGIKFELVLNSGSEAYATIESDKTTLTPTTTNPLDYFFFDEGDGKVHITIQPTDGTSDVGSNQRMEDVNSLMRATWKTGSFYERVMLYDVPTYARGRSDSSLFKAEKINGYWTVYNRNSYTNEFIAKQTEDGWFMFKDMLRNIDGTVDVPSEFYIASVDANDIGSFNPNDTKQTLYLSAFEGFDEYRASKEKVVRDCHYGINYVNTGLYYEGIVDAYKNGTKVYTSTNKSKNDLTPNDPFIYVNGTYSYNVRPKDFANDSYENRALYAAYMYPVCQFSEINDILTTYGLTCKYGNFVELSSSATMFISNISNHLGAINLYGLTGQITNEEFYTRLGTVYTQLDPLPELSVLFA